MPDERVNLPQTQRQLRIAFQITAHEVVFGASLQPESTSPNVEELLESIGAFIDNHNRHPKPFIWTAKASDILEKVKRAQAALA